MAGKAKKFYTREDILRAMRNTSSNRAAARFLRCSYPHYRKYAEMYIDEATGKNLYELHKNQGGKGIPKFTLSAPKRGKKRLREPAIMDILEGRVPIEHFSLQKIKQRLLEMGLLKPVCARCGFKEKRIVDGRSPLIIHHKDEDKKNWRLPNLEFLCYNCTFLNGGVDCPVTDEFVEKAEDYLDRDKMNTTEVFELDEYQKNYLENLGLVDNSKKRGRKPVNEYIATL